jgi:hypothetical protein
MHLEVRQLRRQRRQRQGAAPADTPRLGPWPWAAGRPKPMPVSPGARRGPCRRGAAGAPGGTVPPPWGYGARAAGRKLPMLDSSSWDTSSL